MRRVITYLATVPLAWGCTDLRDLYEERGTMMHVVSVWNEALDGNPTMDATMLLYGEDGVKKEFYQRLNGVSAQVSAGRYDVVLFNGVMESEQATNLDHIYMRGTDKLATFEVCAAEVAPNGRITRADGEYIAATNMALFAFARGEMEIGHADGLSLRYSGGIRVENGNVSYKEILAEFSPRAYSYRFCVRMTGLGNPLSAAYVAGAVRGFAGSIFPATADGVPRMGFPATYHLSFPIGTSRTTRVGEDGGMEIGTVESQTFVTFGPALAAAGERLPDSGVYFFDPVITLVDGSEFQLAAPIDITRQVNDAAVAIADHHNPDGSRITYEDNMFVIEIPDMVVLPIVEKENPGPNPGGDPVRVDDWGPDEPVIIWI